MKIERWVIFGRALIFAVLFATLAFASFGTASAAQTHYVNPGESIQRAIGNAIAGDTIIVRDGTYTENVEVNKSLTIKSVNESYDDVTIIGKDGRDAIKITGNNVSVIGFSLIGTQDILSYPPGFPGEDRTIRSNGISLGGAQDCYIANCSTDKIWVGIYLSSGASNNTIEHNKISMCYASGICVFFRSSNNSILNNAIYDNRGAGINQMISDSSMIANNNISNNTGSGIALSQSRNTVISNNNFSDNGDNDSFGISLFESGNNTVSNNRVIENGNGIKLVAITDSAITGNNVSHNKEDGILVKDSICEIRHNTVCWNGGWGIHAIDSDESVIEDNICENNGISVATIGIGNASATVTNIDTGEDFESIQGAIRDPDTKDGHTIVVSPGVYHESLEVNKALTIKSVNESCDDVTIMVKRKWSPAFYISSDNVSIIGFHVQGSDTFSGGTHLTGGIYFNGVRDCYIANCSSDRTSIGIHLSGASNNTIEHNKISKSFASGILIEHRCANNLVSSNIVYDNREEGLRVKHSRNTVILNNTFSGDSSGITLYWSSNSTIENNTVVENLDGIRLERAEDSTIIGNNISYNKDHGIYLYSSVSTHMIRTTISGNTISHNKDHGIYIRAARDSTITGNTISHNGEAGIYARESWVCTITGNNVSYNEKSGISMSGEKGHVITGTTISGNNVSHNNGAGIYISGADHSTIMNNTANTNSYGIYLSSSSYNTLSNNIFVNDGLFVYSYKNRYKNTVENNTVNSKPLVYLEEALDYKVEDAGQVILVNCENITVENLELSNTSVGVTLLGTKNSKIMNNTANSNSGGGISLKDSSNYNTLTNNTANANNNNGIYLSRSSDNTLTNNTANSNNKYGIYLSYSKNNIFTNNTANSNDYGIRLSSSKNNIFTSNTASSNNKYGIYLDSPSLYFSNRIYNNYFNNTNNAYDDGNSIWNVTKTEGTNIIGGSWLGGNYWSDYTGEDSDGDGIGDTQIPYNSSGDIKNGGDWLPLVKPSASALCDTGACTYPQQEYKNTTGEAITCSTFNHANGKTYTDRMPATRLV